MVEAQEGWRACLAEQGFGTYRNRFEIIEEISDRMAQAGAALADIQAFERRIARIDFDCSIAELEIRRQVEAELSPSFADEMAILLSSADGDD